MHRSCNQEEMRLRPKYTSIFYYPVHDGLIVKEFETSSGKYHTNAYIYSSFSGFCRCVPVAVNL
jgi:hypothetical protein